MDDELYRSVFVSDLSLQLFLSMSLMSMQLLSLAGALNALLMVMIVQVAIMTAFAYFLGPLLVAGLLVLEFSRPTNPVFRHTSKTMTQQRARLGPKSAGIVPPVRRNRMPRGSSTICL